MEISSTSAMDHYRQLQQRIANRSISAEEAVKSYQGMRDKVGGSGAAGGFYVVAQLDQMSLQRVPIADFANSKWGRNNIWGKHNNPSQNNVPSQNNDPAADRAPGSISSIRLIGIHHNIRKFNDIESTTVRGGAFKQDLFQKYNQNAHSILQQFETKHQGEWAKTAQSMGIPITGPDYPGHFFKLPEGVVSDFEAGDPKSMGEKIFRAIANPQEIAAFEQSMQSSQNQLEEGMYKAVAQFTATMIDAGTGAPSQRLDPLRIQELFENQGVDTSRINFAKFVKNDDGSFRVEGNIPNGAEMEMVIQQSPELHALLTKLWDAHGHQGSPSSDRPPNNMPSGLTTANLAPETANAIMLAAQQENEAS